MSLNANRHPLYAVPTNIITGFLGVGKTTAILHLLKHKPAGEHWAVLVNEFGEIGVDGSLFDGQYTEQHGVFIREVPGGCMCCTAGLPMQIALNQLLTRAQPQRLLIEPTGLGHPKEVLEVLTAEHYREVLSVEQTVALVDARKLSNPRYTAHETFNQQLAIADIIIGNKRDLYKETDRQKLRDYIAQQRGSNTRIVLTDHGQLEPELLWGASSAASQLPGNGHEHPPQPHVTAINDEPLPREGYLKVENAGEGYRSIGWRFAPDKVFDRRALYSWLTGLRAERMKAVFITDDGVFGYNLTQDALTEFELDDCMESRIEIIAERIEPEWETALLALVE